MYHNLLFKIPIMRHFNWFEFPTSTNNAAVKIFEHDPLDRISDIFFRVESQKEYYLVKEYRHFKKALKT